MWNSSLRRLSTSSFLTGGEAAAHPHACAHAIQHCMLVSDISAGEFVDFVESLASSDPWSYQVISVCVWPWT